MKRERAKRLDWREWIVRDRGPAVEHKTENGKRVNVCRSGGQTIKVNLDK